MSREVPVSEAARRLGLDYQQCRAQLLKGALAGGRDAFGRLFVEEGALLLALRARGSTGSPKVGQTERAHQRLKASLTQHSRSRSRKRG